jgi:hypothetical protein
VLPLLLGRVLRLDDNIIRQDVSFPFGQEDMTAVIVLLVLTLSDIFSGRSVARNKPMETLIRANQTAE